MINELDQVVLTVDFPESGLVAGDIGTVVHVYGEGEGFEVEFMTLAGSTVGVVTVRRDQVRAVGPKEVAHAREVADA